MNIARPNTRPPRQQGSSKTLLAAIHVSGLKSIYSEVCIEFRPLTLLAGANSSGKSSTLQALLLLKQTLEAPYDPGPLLLNGPNASVGKIDQVQSARTTKKSLPLHIGLDLILDKDSNSTSPGNSLNIELHKSNTSKPYSLLNAIAYGDGLMFTIKEQDTSKVLLSSIKAYIQHDEWSQEIIRHVYSIFGKAHYSKIGEATTNFQSDLEKRVIHVDRNRFFLHPMLEAETEPSFDICSDILSRIIPNLDIAVSDLLTNIIHVSGLRDNPGRTYRETSVGAKFAGMFDTYTASVIADWENTQPESFKQLNKNLYTLDLTSKIAVHKLKDAEVELLVNRALGNGADKDELVSIADVGLGVSQVLPVLVALIVAKPGQLVYIEQPEIHLHPKAQVKLADIICAASSRGVIVVIETHSALLVRSIQTLIAKGEMDNEKAIFHWFTRVKGETKVDSAVPDHLGRVGAWPEDFSDTELEAESRYLTEVQKRRGKDNGT
jgi:hypothetical protein